MKIPVAHTDQVCGIYVIRHRASGREYVGSSVDIYKRAGKHKSDLSKNRHHSPILQNAWNKHGADEFEMEVVEVVSNPALLLLSEQAWLDKGAFYNVCKFARNRLGFRATDETKARQSAALTGLKRTPEQVENIRQSQMGKVLSAEHRAKCGRKGVAKPDGFAEKLRIARTGSTMGAEGVEKMAESKRKAYRFVSPSGETFAALGLRKFCREHGLNPSAMSALAITGVGKAAHKGWLCEYEQPVIARQH